MLGGCEDTAMLPLQAMKGRSFSDMKKWIALMLMTLLVVVCGAVAAEEKAFDGVWVQFPEGFELMLPSDWLQVELTAEMEQAGVFYCAASADGANTVQISWKELEEGTGIDEIEAELAATYPDARQMVINGIATVAFTDKNSDVAGYAMLDSMKPGLYTFFMTPASDQSFKDTATSIAISIRNMQE